jgi:methyl-accepting chemotaxis protein
MLVMGILSYSKSSRILLSQTNVQVENLTTKEMKQLDTFLTIYRNQMDNLSIALRASIDNMQAGVSIDPGIKELTLIRLTEYLKKYPAIRRVRLLDKEGNEKFTTLKDKTDLEKESSSPWFQKALSGGEACLSEMFLSKDANEPVLVMAKTVENQLEQGKAVGVVAAEIWGRQVTASLENVKLGKEGYAFILDREGYVIAHPDKSKLLKLNLRDTDFGKEVLSKKNGAIDYIWEGKERFASFQEYPSMQWVIITSVPKEDVLSPIRETRNQFIIMGIVIAGIALVTAAVLSLRIARPIRGVVEGLTKGAEQMSSASEQISRASQQVAQGANEQASGIEEASSSLEEIASMTKQNSNNAQEARIIGNEVSQIIKNVQSHMEQMGTAIAETTALSEETSKIIKTIDEIAFQTNLLALNAAVEAARAGEAGAGFSVVANEVRNLAMKASEAAKNTSHLIENTIKAVKKGNDLAQSTRAAFEKITTVAERHGRLTDEIAAASQEQAQGIEQVSGMIQDLLAVVGGSNGAHNAGSRVSEKARQLVGRLQQTTASPLLHVDQEGQTQAAGGIGEESLT